MVVRTRYMALVLAVGTTTLSPDVHATEVAGVQRSAGAARFLVAPPPPPPPHGREPATEAFDVFGPEPAPSESAPPEPASPESASPESESFDLFAPEPTPSKPAPSKPPQSETPAARSPLPTGKGALVSGVLLSLAGGATMILNLRFITNGRHTVLATEFWLPQVVPAVAVLGLGVPLAVEGGRRRRNHRLGTDGSDRKPPKGVALLAGGLLGTFVGLPISIVAIHRIRTVEVKPWEGIEEEIEAAKPHIPAAVSGLVLLSVGVPMFAVGMMRRVQSERWRARRVSFSPAMNRTTRGTWVAGFSLRF